MSSVKISQVFIQYKSKLLLQLRDFKNDINFPGHWGFFAGHIKKNETPIITIKRELKEELLWQPKKIVFISTLNYLNKFQVYAFKCKLDVPFEKLKLLEGEEMFFFDFNYIQRKILYSKKYNLHFPISPLSHSVFLKIRKKLYND